MSCTFLSSNSGSGALSSNCSNVVRARFLNQEGMRKGVPVDHGKPQGLYRVGNENRRAHPSRISSSALGRNVLLVRCESLKWSSCRAVAGNSVALRIGRPLLPHHRRLLEQWWIGSRMGLRSGFGPPQWSHNPYQYEEGRISKAQDLEFVSSSALSTVTAFNPERGSAIRANRPVKNLECLR
jgi:hypothetical protein